MFLLLTRDVKKAAHSSPRSVSTQSSKHAEGTKSGTRSEKLKLNSFFNLFAYKQIKVKSKSHLAQDITAEL